MKSRVDPNLMKQNCSFQAAISSRLEFQAAKMSIATYELKYKTEGILNIFTDGGI